MPDDEISYALDLEDAEWLALRDKLVERHMVATREVDGALIILNWDERQYDKPSDSPTATAERKRRSRAAQSAQIVPEVTPVSHPVTPRHATDKRRGEEIREEMPSASTRARAEAAAASPTGKLFDSSQPLPVAVENFLTHMPNPQRCRERLLLELTGRELQCLDRYALAMLREWKQRGGPPEPKPARQARPTLEQAVAHVNHTVHQLVTEGDGF